MSKQSEQKEKQGFREHRFKEGGREMTNETKELNLAAANYRKFVFDPGNYCFDSKVEIKRIEDAFAAGAKWFEEQLNSIPEVEPKQKRKDDETDENFFRFFKSKCEYNKGNCCIKHGGKIACCIQNCHSFKEWL